MARITTISNSKGGAGKTTTAHALATGLKNRGYKTLLIDLDHQANATMQCGIKATGDTFTSLDFMRGYDGTVTTADGLDVLPANKTLRSANDVLTGMGKAYRLREALEPIKDNYDYIIIDTAPSLEALTLNALVTSDDVIIPAQADAFNLQGITELRHVIDDVRKYSNPKLRIAGILLNRYNARTSLNKYVKGILDDIAKTLNTCVFKTTIPQCIAISDAQMNQTDIYTSAPKSTGATRYNEFIDEYIAQEEA